MNSIRSIRWELIRPATLLTLVAAAVFALAGAASAATWNPATAADLTTALNNSALGDTIVLQAGTTYTGSFTLPNKTTGTGWVTIQSSALASLPPAGTRVFPANAANMPKIVSPGGNGSAIKTVFGSHHFKFVGVEIIGAADNSAVTNLVLLGDFTQTTLSQVPNNLAFERCIIRANSTTQTLRRAIGLSSASTDILDCYIAGCKEVGADSQGIGGANGPGPYNIINNYIEGAGENVMFGGSDPTIPNLVPSDIVFKRNHCYKPLTWKIGDPSYAGTAWTVKNIFELKNARNVTVEGNLFEHNWPHGQAGAAILFTVRNQDGNAPWCVVENVTFKNNILRKTAAAFNTLGIDNNHPSGMANNIRIENNLVYDVGGSQWGGNGLLYQLLSQTDAMTFKHNTSFHTGNVIGVDGGPHTNFVFTDNLQAHNAYGVIGSNHGVGNDSLNFFFTNPSFTKNVLMGGNANSYSQYPGNFFPATWSGVLVDQANPGSAFAGWKVVNGSAYDNSGTDGKDIGADIDAINTATAGCISGVWGSGGGGTTTTTVSLKNGVNGYNGNTSFGVSGQSPTANLGASDYKHVANQLPGTNGFVYRPFYKFDLSPAASAIPAGAVITSATLQLKAEYSTGNPGDGGIKIHRAKPVNNAFTINYATATRNTYNGANTWTGGANAAGNVTDANNDFLDTPDSTTTLPSEGSSGNITFNVTSSVQAWVNGEANNGWVVLPTGRTVYLGTSGDLHGSADFPVLTVTYQSAAPSVTKVLKNGVNGYTGATSFGVSGQNPTTHFGPSDYKQVANQLSGSNGFVYRPFYKFDLTQGANAIPSGATIESATLSVKVEYSTGSADGGVNIHRAKPVNNAFTIDYATATRNTYNASSAWTGGANAGGDVANANNDFVDTPDSSTTMPAEGLAGTITFNVTSSVQAWVNGEANNGWLILPTARTAYLGTPADLHGPGDFPVLTITYH
jgi:hypothetical protein